MTDYAQVTQTVTNVVAEQLKLDPLSLSPEKTLDFLGADSLDRVEIVMRLEELLSIEIDDERIENIATLGELTQYVASLVR